jgi:hypothetical protein
MCYRFKAQNIEADTTAIRQDTAILKVEFARLSGLLSQKLQEDVPRGQQDLSQNLILKNYLDSCTSYAETVIGEIEDEPDFEAPLLVGNDAQTYGRGQGKLSKMFSTRKPKDSPTAHVLIWDLPKQRLPGQKVTPKEVRELLDLIRKRYYLDVEIWSLRHARPRDREILEDKIRIAEAALAKLCRIVDSWDTPDAFASSEDYAKFLEIKRRLHAEGKRDWVANPPWEG